MNMNIDELKTILKDLYNKDFKVLEVVQEESEYISVIYKIPYCDDRKECQIDVNLSIADMIDDVANEMFFSCDELIHDINEKRDELNYITDKKLSQLSGYTRMPKKI